MTTTKKPKATKKAPAKKSTPAKKAPAKKKAAASKPKEPAPKPDPHAQAATAMFREIRNWQDCKDQKIKVHHPALGPRFYPAKVLQVDLTAGSVLVFIPGKKGDDTGHKGRFLLPLDSTVAQVK